TEEAPAPAATRTLVRQEAAIKTAPTRPAPVVVAESQPVAVAAPVSVTPAPSLFKGLVKSLVGLFASKEEEQPKPVAEEKKPTGSRPARSDERRSGRQQNRSRSGARRDEERKPREDRQPREERAPREPREERQSREERPAREPREERQPREGQ